MSQYISGRFPPRRYARTSTTDLEHYEQKTLIEWTVWTERWEFELFWSYPAGGKRTKGQAGKTKGEGQKTGVPDLFLSLSRAVGHQRFHGLYIEMKVGKRKPGPKQRRIIGLLQDNGYKVDVCYSAVAGARVLLEYLDLSEKQYIDPYTYFRGA